MDDTDMVEYRKHCLFICFHHSKLYLKICCDMSRHVNKGTCTVTVYMAA